MDDSNRGKIQNRERARQIRDFSGLRYGTKTPTDIDGLIEDSEKCYVFLETKVKGTALPLGQLKALIRMCDDLGSVKPTLLIISEHETKPEEDIPMAETVVTRYRWSKKWKNPKAKTTVRHLVDLFLGKYGTWQVT